MTRTVLRVKVAAPTLFLLDDFHHCDTCTDDNVQIALDLFKQGVCLAGVEGFEGGREWLYHDQQPGYSDSVVSDAVGTVPGIGDYPRFALALRAAALPVVGVDCAGMCDQVLVDAYDGTWPASAGRHPNHRLRSTHFVSTLLVAAQARGLTGDLLINCGAEHNSDIATVVGSAGQLPPGWPDWNYVRIRSSHFAACQ